MAGERRAGAGERVVWWGIHSPVLLTLTRSLRYSVDGIVVVNNCDVLAVPLPPPPLYPPHTHHYDPLGDVFLLPHHTHTPLPRC